MFFKKISSKTLQQKTKSVNNNCDFDFANESLVNKQYEISHESRNTDGCEAAKF